MSKTIAIYGIQDVSDAGYPVYIHDHSICIAEEGKILKNIHLERYTGKKYDNSLPKHLNEILKKEKLLNINDDYQIVFVDSVIGRNFINREGNIRFEAPLLDSVKTDVEEGFCLWAGKKPKAFVLNHELAHIFSCLPFYGKFKDNSLLVHFDGGASKSNFSVFTYKAGKIEMLTNHWKLKKITSLFNANALAFAITGANIKDQNAVPGKLMGFASFGKFKPEIEKWLESNNFFEDIWGNKEPFFQAAKEEFGIDIQHIDTKNTFIQDIAGCFQEVFTRELLKEINYWQKETGCDYLYYSGGCALNITANKAIEQANIFKEIFIPPCCSDSGLALGAAAFMQFRNKEKIRKHTPFLNNFELPEPKQVVDKNIVKQAAQMLSEQKILASYLGNSEIGPRALGNRSILSLASSKSLAQKVSMNIKKREWYRPVAPIMLKRNAKYFTGLSKLPQISKYMLTEFDILPEKQKELEGAVHVNGTARIQVIFTPEDHPFIYELLNELDVNYGIKALINTSFNIKGQTMVHYKNIAIETAKKMNLSGLITEDELFVL